MFMRRRVTGFTLVETLVSVLISVVLLGAATVASRSVSQTTEIGREQVQMNSIADTIFNLVQLSQSADTSFLKNALDSNPFVYGEFHDSGGHLYYTSTIQWSRYNPTSGYDLSTYAINPNVVPVSFNGSHAQTIFASSTDLESNAPFGTIVPVSNIVGSNVPVTSLVSVCTHPQSGTLSSQIAICENPNGTANQYFKDNGSNFLLRSPWDGPSNINLPGNLPPPDIDDPSWTIYEVSVQLAKPGVSPPTPGVSPPTYVAYGPSPAVQKAMQDNTYTATVKVANYHAPQHQISRTMSFTAWQQ